MESIKGKVARPRPTVAIGMTAGICLFLALVLAGGQAFGQQSKQQKIKQAMEYFNAAEFDKTIELLSSLADDTSLDKVERRGVLLELGRAYFAKNLQGKAKEVIAKLLDLEPPLVTLDPDAEAPPLMKIYYDVRKTKTGSTQVEKADPGMKTIAVLDFKNRSVDDKVKFDPMEKGFSELMIGQLNGSVNLKVVERERIQWILDEIGLENDPAKFDVGSAVRIGKQLGVHSVLLGSFIKFKNDLWLGIRLVKVETSEILATDEIRGEADDFFELAEKLSVKIAKKINANLSEADAKKGTETNSLDAMLTYSEGLVYLEKANYKAAYDKFQEALKLDPNYSKAKTKADSLKPLLG